jgi:hypothetical protein
MNGWVKPFLYWKYDSVDFLDLVLVNLVSNIENEKNIKGAILKSPYQQHQFFGYQINT